MSELKPCPFCGKLAKLTSIRIPFDSGSQPKVAQCECGVFLNAKRWNIRPIESALSARVAELEKDLSDSTAQLILDDEVVNSLRSLTAELKADAERLAEKWVSIDDDYDSGYCCQHCAEEALPSDDGSGFQCEHSPDCVMLSHRLLMARIEEK